MENKDFITQLTECEQQLQNYHMPRFNELPNYGFYMDQVVGYVNQVLNVFNEPDVNLITPSMINNYVKHGIMPPPNGKKYSNVHLAYICAIYFLKQVLSMDEIKNAINHQLKYNNSLQAYTYFCDELENAFKNCCVLTKSINNATSVQNETEYALKAVTISIANLVYAQKVIALQTEKEPPELSDEEKREQKEQEKPRKKEIKEEKKKDKKTAKQKSE